MSQLLLPLQPPPKPTLQDFFTDRSALILQALKPLFNPGKTGLVYVWGTLDSGRTHLLEACQNESAGIRPTLLMKGTASTLTWDIPDGALVMIDDIEELNTHDQQQLFFALNNRIHQKVAFVFTCSAPPASMQIREDLRTRLGQGLTYELTSPSDSERMAILNRYAQARSFPLNDHLLHYLMTRSSRDLTTLISLIDNMDQLTLEQHRKPTRPLAKKLISS